MCSCSGLITSLAFIFLTAAFMACAVGFGGPWVKFTGQLNIIGSVLIGQFVDSVYVYEGLLARCGTNLPDDCKWVWQNDFGLESVLPEWHKGAQAVYAIGLTVLFTCLLLAIMHVCCRCCKRHFSLATVLGALLVIGAVLIGAATAVFGVFQHNKNDVALFQGSGKGFFIWGSFLAVGGAGLALLSSFLFLCEGCRGSRSPDGYETARMI